MKRLGRRGFVAAGLGAVCLPASAIAQEVWTDPFVGKWVHGAWLATVQGSAAPSSIIEIYSHSPSTDERGSFVLRAGGGPADQVPTAVSKATVRPSAARAKVKVAFAGGQCDVDWQASDTQEGTLLTTTGAVPVKLRRLQAAEIDEQRAKAFGGEKPIFINTSYFG
jgi:hypothetical protein